MIGTVISSMLEQHFWHLCNVHVANAICVTWILTSWWGSQGGSTQVRCICCGSWGCHAFRVAGIIFPNWHYHSGLTGEVVECPTCPINMDSSPDQVDQQFAFKLVSTASPLSAQCSSSIMWREQIVVLTESSYNSFICPSSKHLDKSDKSILPCNYMYGRFCNTQVSLSKTNRSHVDQPHKMFILANLSGTIAMILTKQGLCHKWPSIYQVLAYSLLTKETKKKFVSHCRLA